jgi:hypothetical protein
LSGISMQRWREWEAAGDAVWAMALSREAVIRPLAEQRRLSGAYGEPRTRALPPLRYRLLLRSTLHPTSRLRVLPIVHNATKLGACSLGVEPRVPSSLPDSRHNLTYRVPRMWRSRSAAVRIPFSSSLRQVRNLLGTSTRDSLPGHPRLPNQRSRRRASVPCNVVRRLAQPSFARRSEWPSVAPLRR